jgi:hypothetical protein
MLSIYLSKKIDIFSRHSAAYSYFCKGILSSIELFLIRYNVFVIDRSPKKYNQLVITLYFALLMR